MWWLLLLPLTLVPAWISYELFHRRVRRSFLGKGLVDGMVVGAGFGRRLATFACVFIALELLSVAAMRPKYGLKDFTVKGAGVDVAIVVDASRSMKTDDVMPDRLGISVMTVSKVLEKAAGNRFSLVPFAGIAFIQSPLTVDHGIIRQYLNDLRVTDMPVAGTALGRALSTAARSLGIGTSGFKGSAGKAIIVLTDGENHEGEPLEIASGLADEGVRIFTIGVGTPEGRPIPKLDEKGDVIGLAPPEDGDGPVISKLDEELLKTLADRTGGRFYSLSSVASIDSVSQALAADLESMQRDEYLTAVERLLEERFQYPLAAGLLVLVLPFLWMGMRSKKTMVAMMVGLVVMSAAPASAQPFEHPVLAALFNRQQPDVKAAIRLMEDGKFGDALAKLQEVAKKLPAAPAIEYDTAIAAMLAGELQVAEDSIGKAISLNSALATTSPQRLSDSDLLATKGSILVEKAGKVTKEGGDRREALTFYRQAADSFVSALLLDPADEDLRRTLEIVSLAAWPACSSLDDAHEVNDSLEQASPLAPDAQTGAIEERLLLCPDNHDWFSLTLRPGETVNLSVQKPSKDGGQAAQAGQEPPKPEPADVDVELVAPDGSSLVPPGKSARYTSHAAVDTTVLLYVAGPSVEDGVDYVISASIVPSCQAGGDDRMEDNDLMSAAASVQDGELDLRVCPLDDDFFSYALPKETARQVKLTFLDQDGPLDLAILAGDGTPVEVQTQTAQDGTSRVAVLPTSDADSQFTIAVSGGGSEGFYRLEIGDPEGDKDKDQDQDQDQDQDKKDDQKDDEDGEQPPQPQGSSAIRQLIDELDSNRDNIDAREAERNSSLGNHTPDKDW